MHPIIEKPKAIAQVVDGKTGKVEQQGVRIRLVRPDGRFSYRRNFTGYILGYPYVTGHRLDEGKKPYDGEKPSDGGNFEAESSSRTTIPEQNYNSYSLYLVELPEVPGIRARGTAWCRKVDHAKNLWDTGNCELVEGEQEEVEYRGEKRIRYRTVTRPFEYNAFTYLRLQKLGEKEGEVVETVYGRAVNPTQPYWDPMNFEVFRTSDDGTTAWVSVELEQDFSSNIWKRERISPKMKLKSALDETKRYEVETEVPFEVTPWDTRVAVAATRFILDAGPGLHKAIDDKVKTSLELGADPTRLWLTLQYVLLDAPATKPEEKADGKPAIPHVNWVIEAKPMTPQEIAAAAERDAETANPEPNEAHATQPPVAAETAPDPLDDTSEFDMSQVPF